MTGPHPRLSGLESPGLVRSVVMLVLGRSIHESGAATTGIRGCHGRGGALVAIPCLDAAKDIRDLGRRITFCLLGSSPPDSRGPSPVMTNEGGALRADTSRRSGVTHAFPKLDTGEPK